MRRAMFLGLVMAAIFGAGNAHAFKRGIEKANPTFPDFGDSADRAAVLLGTTTPVAVLSTQTYASGLRQMEVCNPTGFTLFVGTFSTVSGSTLTVVNARESIPTGLCRSVMFNTPLWAILESASGSVSRIITTVIRFQSGE